MHHRLMDRNLSHGQSAATLVAISLSFAFLGTLALGGRLWVAIAIVLAILEATYLIRVFRYDEFPLFATLAKKVLDHRYTTDAHLQLREVAETMEKMPPESIRQLRLVVSELLAGLGFAEAILEVPELGGEGRWSAERGVMLEFPLSTRLETIGCLRVRWDLRCAMPLDLGLFVAEFLPVLTRSVQWHIQAHREAARPSAFSVRNAQRPRLVSSLREVETAELSPLQD